MTGIQQVTGLILNAATYLLYRFGHKFYGHSLPTADLGTVVVSCWRKYGHLVLVNRLGSLPRNRVDRFTDWLDVTLIVLTVP